MIASNSDAKEAMQIPQHSSSPSNLSDNMLPSPSAVSPITVGREGSPSSPIKRKNQDAESPTKTSPFVWQGSEWDEEQVRSTPPKPVKLACIHHLFLPLCVFLNTG